jgi:hypothetical protein
LFSILLNILKQLYGIILVLFQRLAQVKKDGKKFTGSVSHIIQKNQGITLLMLTHAVETFLDIKEGMVCETKEVNENLITINCFRRGKWKKYFLFDNRHEIVITEGPKLISLEILEAHWLVKGFIYGIGMVLLSPVLLPVNSIFSLDTLSLFNLPDKVFTFVNAYILSGGMYIMLDGSAEDRLLMAKLQETAAGEPPLFKAPEKEKTDGGSRDEQTTLDPKQAQTKEAPTGEDLRSDGVASQEKERGPLKTQEYKPIIASYQTERTESDREDEFEDEFNDVFPYDSFNDVEIPSREPPIPSQHRSLDEICELFADGEDLID